MKKKAVTFFLFFLLIGTICFSQNPPPNYSGEWVVHYETGQVKEKLKYNNGEIVGEWICYYSDGKTEVKKNHTKGKANGEWVWYYENGQVSVKGKFVEGQKEDEWVMYYDDGKICNKTNYIKGKEIKSISFDKQGNIKKTTHPVF
jgi:antitoxin component YwqK of YwqJK toxin-antitoxin module